MSVVEAGAGHERELVEHPDHLTVDGFGDDRVDHRSGFGVNESWVDPDPVENGRELVWEPGKERAGGAQRTKTGYIVVVFTNTTSGERPGSRFAYQFPNTADPVTAGAGVVWSRSMSLRVA